jgi:hypothetical protein
MSVIIIKNIMFIRELKPKGINLIAYLIAYLNLRDLKARSQ